MGFISFQRFCCGTNIVQVSLFVGRLSANSAYNGFRHSVSSQGDHGKVMMVWDVSEWDADWRSSN